MANTRGQSNSILRQHRRPFNLSKCNLEGCHNFISTFGYKGKHICSSHQYEKCKTIRASLKGYKRIKDYSEENKHTLNERRKLAETKGY